jgi:hypothetical protein
VLQVWLPTVQEVLQADWQDVWQAPHSGVSSGFLRLPATIVLMCTFFFILLPPCSVKMFGLSSSILNRPRDKRNVLHSFPATPFGR